MNYTLTSFQPIRLLFIKYIFLVRYLSLHLVYPPQTLTLQNVHKEIVYLSFLSLSLRFHSISCSEDEQKIVWVYNNMRVIN